MRSIATMVKHSERSREIWLFLAQLESFSDSSLYKLQVQRGSKWAYFTNLLILHITRTRIDLLARILAARKKLKEILQQNNLDLVFSVFGVIEDMSRAIISLEKCLRPARYLTADPP